MIRPPSFPRKADEDMPPEISTKWCWTAQLLLVLMNCPAWTCGFFTNFIWPGHIRVYLDVVCLITIGTRFFLLVFTQTRQKIWYGLLLVIQVGCILLLVIRPAMFKFPLKGYLGYPVCRGTASLQTISSFRAPAYLAWRTCYCSRAWKRSLFFLWNLQALGFLIALGSNQIQ